MVKCLFLGSFCLMKRSGTPWCEVYPLRLSSKHLKAYVNCIKFIQLGVMHKTDYIYAHSVNVICFVYSLKKGVSHNGGSLKWVIRSGRLLENFYKKVRENYSSVLAIHVYNNCVLYSLKIFGESYESITSWECILHVKSIGICKCLQDNQSYWSGFCLNRIIHF